VDRKEACLAQAAVCRAKAEADTEDRDYWINEAIRWLERAAAPTGRVAISFERAQSPIRGDRNQALFTSLHSFSTSAGAASSRSLSK
jgi:hypothetical protein